MISIVDAEDRKGVYLFLKKCREDLQAIEKEILRLETGIESCNIVNNIIHLLHKVKRGASFFGLVGVNRVIYEMEYFLGLIQKEEEIPKTDQIDQLLLGIDFITSYSERLYHILKEEHFDENTMKYFEFVLCTEELETIEKLEAAHVRASECVSEGISEEAVLEERNDLPKELEDKLKQGLVEDVREQFLIETAEHLDMLENDIIIQLDSNKDHREAINEMFRMVHSIKGVAGIYLASLSTEEEPYEDVKHFIDEVHSFENLLSLIRNRSCSFENRLVDLSLQVFGYLRCILKAIDYNEVFQDRDPMINKLINEEIARIEALPISITESSMSNKKDIKPDDEPRSREEEISKVKDNKLDNLKNKGSLTQSIRVNQDKIDSIMNIISELIITKNYFSHISEKLVLEYNLPDISKEVKQVGANVNRISDELQNSIMSIRMVEVKTVFQKMPRMIRDIAQNTGKKIELIMEGDSTEIDKSIIEHISDPLVHIIRNSADHGIESVEERLKKGKPETGKIILRAYNKNKYVFIEVEDDGKGMDTAEMKAKAIEKSFITAQEAEKMGHNQLLNLIFLPGFSMASKITEVSGRGVGMDIVKSNINKIHGNISIESEVDKGTKMTIRLPLSLAVSHGLIVEVSGENYIIPLENIVETVKIQKKNIHMFNQKYFTYLRETVIGLEWLEHIFLLGQRKMDLEEYNAVILTDGVENFAIIVDRLKNEQEFVMKTLDGQLSSIPGISGSTLLGNGQVVLIVNPTDLIKLAG